MAGSAAENLCRSLISSALCTGLNIVSPASAKKRFALHQVQNKPFVCFTRSDSFLYSTRFIRDSAESLFFHLCG